MRKRNRNFLKIERWIVMNIKWNNLLSLSALVLSVIFLASCSILYSSRSTSQFSESYDFFFSFDRCGRSRHRKAVAGKYNCPDKRFFYNSINQCIGTLFFNCLINGCFNTWMNMPDWNKQYHVGTILTCNACPFLHAIDWNIELFGGEEGEITQPSATASQAAHDNHNYQELYDSL